MGRPSSFTPECADIICERLANGESLRKICLDEEMPDQKTVLRWLARGDLENAEEEFATFRQQYARAREMQADTIFDEMLDIADDGANDYMGEDEKYNGDAVQRSRLRIDTRKWMAGKLKPKVYGDKTLLGSDPENPLPNGFAVNLVKRDDQTD